MGAKMMVDKMYDISVFKPGDKIRFLTTNSLSGRCIFGGIYTVKSCNHGKENNYVYLEENNDTWYTWRFELVTPAPSSPVDSPNHYNSGSLECIDAIEASMSRDEFLGYLKGNTLKYLWRYRYKGKPEEDLKKAQWYLDKLTTTYTKDKND